MYKCINEFEKRHQARTKLLKDVNSRNILTGGRITSVIQVKDVKQNEIYTAAALVLCSSWVSG
jgi:hypothetical protein